MFLLLKVHCSEDLDDRPEYGLVEVTPEIVKTFLAQLDAALAFRAAPAGAGLYETVYWDGYAGGCDYLASVGFDPDLSDTEELDPMPVDLLTGAPATDQLGEGFAVLLADRSNDPVANDYNTRTEVDTRHVYVNPGDAATARDQDAVSWEALVKHTDVNIRTDSVHRGELQKVLALLAVPSPA